MDIVTPAQQAVTNGYGLPAQILLQKGPAICGGCESREELQTKLIRGTNVYRN
jgi:hypothetical protein